MVTAETLAARVAKTLVVAVFTATALLTPVRAQEPAETSAPDVVEQQVDISPRANDNAIAQRLTDIFEATDWFPALNVRVEDGVVFLTGTALSQEHSDWAQRLAARTGDVVAVVNNLDVTPEVEWSIAPALDELRRLAESVIVAGPLIVVALFVLPLAFFAARLVARVVRWLLGSRVHSPLLRDVAARTIAFPVFLVGLYIVLQVAGLTQLALSLLGGAGVLGIVIGFAFRDIAENFLASLLLSMRRPFSGGDLISVAGHTGLVQSMNTRSTILITPEGNHIQIPNAVIFKNTIENQTAARYSRDNFSIGIGYDDTIADVQDLILDVLKRHESVADDPQPMALIDALGDSAVILKAYYWFDVGQVSHIKLKSSLLRQVKRVLMDAGVSMPDAAREVIFPQGVPLSRFEPRPADVSPSDHEAPGAPKLSEKDEPLHAASDRDLSTDTDLLERQFSARIEESDVDLLCEDDG